MTPEVRMRTLAALDSTLQGYLGTAPFRWFDQQLPNRSITSGSCVRIQRISTIRMYEQAGLNPLSYPRFQADCYAADPETARAVALAVIAFLGGVNLSSDGPFASPSTTPRNFPTFILSQRDGIIPDRELPVYVQSIDFRAFAKET